MFKKFLFWWFEVLKTAIPVSALLINSWFTSIIGLTLLVEFEQGYTMGVICIISSIIGYLFGFTILIKKVIQYFRGRK